MIAITLWMLYERAHSGVQNDRPVALSAKHGSTAVHKKPYSHGLS
jgi:hypothetical protein